MRTLGETEGGGSARPAREGRPASPLEAADLDRSTLRLPADVQPFSPLIGPGGRIEAVRKLLGRAAASDLPVLLSGESGTGKRAIARLLHQESRRAGGPWIEESAAAIPEALFESEMFGYLSGAFTDARRDRTGRIQEAQGGTLFLPEVCDIPLACQRKLLRPLEQRKVRPLGATEEVEVDLRLLTSSSRPLQAEVEAGRFLPELHRAIAVVEARLPALRERREDLPFLARAFLAQESLRTGRRIGIDEESIEKLKRHDWPGNLRELENVLRRALLFGDRIRPEDIELGPPPPAAVTAPLFRLRADRRGYREARQEFDRDIVRDALLRSGGNVSRAAASLGLNRRSLYKMMRRSGLTPPRR